MVDAATATVDRALPATRGVPAAARPAARPRGTATVVAASGTPLAAARVTTVGARTAATGVAPMVLAGAPRAVVLTVTVPRAVTVVPATGRTVTVARAIVGTEHAVTVVARTSVVRGARAVRARARPAASTAQGGTTVPAVVTTGHRRVTGAAPPGRVAPGTSGRRVRGRASAVGTTARRPTVAGTGRVLVTTDAGTAPVPVTSAGAGIAAGTPRVQGRAVSGTASTVARSHATLPGRRSLTRCRSLSSTALPEGGCGR
ncbi:hypothetical protein M2316_004076 [Cellulosimicrobium cellulans]|nr:hypothetical protein [Cellulosimicrobium cellulans]